MTTTRLLETLTGFAERAMDNIALRIAATVNLRLVELERQVTLLRRDVDDALALAREHTTRPTISR